MNRSESVALLAEALAKAQCDMNNPGFDTTNPHFRSRFASLAAVRNAVIPVLAAHGISLTQDLHSTERGVACFTLLLHSSGQWQEYGPLEIPASKADAQGFGSAATYARRYHMQAVAGVVGDEDDDGNQAVASQGATREPARKVVEANVQPTAGALESLQADMQKQVVDMGIEVSEMFRADPRKAYALYCSYRDGGLAEETEAKVALRAQLSAPIRTQFQKFAAEAK